MCTISRKSNNFIRPIKFHITLQANYYSLSVRLSRIEQCSISLQYRTFTIFRHKFQHSLSSFYPISLPINLFISICLSIYLSIFLRFFIRSQHTKQFTKNTHIHTIHIELRVHCPFGVLFTRRLCTRVDTAIFLDNAT